ncbi:MAG: site-specific DNA-methyltransferase [Acidobacteriota bacterium]|nr:site-specific DNA-methyltransferase [Acidobacteriota bacterium]
MRRKQPDLKPDMANLKPLDYNVLRLKGSQWQKLGKKKREDVVDSCVEYWRTRGFPYYKLSEIEIKEEYQRLQRTLKQRILIGNEIQMSMVGVKLANYFHPQMWGVRVNGAHAPLERFNSDDKLRMVINRALTIWSDRHSINECNLRSMLRIFSNTTRVSNFRPTAAKAIFEEYSKDGDPVIDFSAGYGGRLLGCMTLNRHYIGIEPCRDQVRGLHRMVAKLNKLVKPETRVTIHQGCAEDILTTLESKSVSLVFSSPPYFNNERYSKESSQSYIKYPVYEEWIKCFLEKVLCESHRILKPRGQLLMNIADIEGFELTKDVVRLARKYFTLENTLQLRLGHKPYLRNRTGKVYKHEPIFVFRKLRGK